MGTWMMDKYQINYIPPDLAAWETGIVTLNRYASRWILTQHASTSNAEGLEFDLIDISVSTHLKALSLMVTFQWKERSEHSACPFGKELLWQTFTKPTEIPKKKLYESKSIAADSFMTSFDKICQSSQQVVTQCKLFL